MLVTAELYQVDRRNNEMKKIIIIGLMLAALGLQAQDPGSIPAIGKTTSATDKGK